MACSFPRRLAWSLALASGLAAAMPPLEGAPPLLPAREQVAEANAILDERLQGLLPRLMRETGFDAWLVLNREYAEDPVYFTLVPQPTHAARRTTLLAFFLRPDGDVDRFVVNRYPLGGPYESAWAGGDLDAQWQALGKLVAERNPRRIGINTSRDWAVADGLSHALHARLLEVLPADMHGRLASAETLVVRWLETRLPRERAHHAAAMATARAVIAEAFSTRVITPGVTSTEDVAWYIRARFESLGLPVWFQPDVNRQRAGDDCNAGSTFCGGPGVIEAGDVLHTDVGACYLGLCTDTQEMGYVARPGEDDAPAGLRAALARGNRWQDLLLANFAQGRTGAEVLARTRRDAAAEGIASSTYTHPLGVFGHAPGPTIGMWDDQSGTTPGSDWPLHDATAYAIEGNVLVPVPEWGGQHVQVKLEQGAWFEGGLVRFPAGRQTQWHLVR